MDILLSLILGFTLGILFIGFVFYTTGFDEDE